MKKLLTYILITTLILGFSIDNNAYAEKMNNYNIEVIKLQSEYSYSFSDFSIKNTVQTLNSNNFEIAKRYENESRVNNDFTPLLVNFIIPGYTQFYYGDTAKGMWFLGGTILPIVLFPVSTNLFYIAGALIVYIIPIAYIWSLIDAYSMVSERSRLSKAPLKNNNLFDIALFSKDF